MDIRWFDSLNSTNQYCKLLDPATVGEFTVICAHSQTAGIGQQGNVWISEPSKNLTFSIILKPSFLAAADQYRLTMALAVAVAECVDCLLSNLNPRPSVQIKWPNDIYVGNSKICGILATSQLIGQSLSQSICGIGLNINQTCFPEWIPNPTSLRLLTNHDYSLDDVLHSLLDSIGRCYRQIQVSEGCDDIRDRYLNRLYRLGVEAGYLYGGKEIRATINGIDHFGRLLLTGDDGRRLTCDLKEIRFL